MDDQLYEKLIILFPTCPFIISVVDDINEINEIFSDETVLFIYDDRANKYNYYYEGYTDTELDKMKNYTMVKSSNGKFITLRDIIEAMINDDHYHDKIISGDPHCFLEGFSKSKKSDIQYTAIFGS